SLESLSWGPRTGRTTGGASVRRAKAEHARHHSRRATPIRRFGGARRDRTDDLMLAKHALSHLRYGPSLVREAQRPGNTPAVRADPKSCSSEEERETKAAA